MNRFLSIMTWLYVHLRGIWVAVAITAAAALINMVWPASVTPVLPLQVLPEEGKDNLIGSNLIAENSLDFIDRPLFSPERQRPQPPDKGDTAEASPLPAAGELIQLEGVELLGTFGSGEQGGIIVNLADGERTRLATGETLSGWTLLAVRPREAQFQNASGAEAIVGLALASNLPALRTMPDPTPLTADSSKLASAEMSRQGESNAPQEGASKQNTDYRGPVTFDSIAQDQRRRIQDRERPEATREAKR